MNNPLNDDIGNPFFDDYFFTKTAYDKPTSTIPGTGRFQYGQDLYGKPRDIAQVDADAQTIWSRIFSRGKSSSVTTQEINSFLKQEFSGLEQQSKRGAFTFLTSNTMPKGVVSADDYTSRSLPRSILFTQELIGRRISTLETKR